MRPKDAFLHFTEQRQCKTCPATSSNGPTTQCQRYDRDLSRIKKQDVPIFRMTIPFLSSFRSYAPICVCRGMKSSRVKPFEVSANYTSHAKAKAQDVIHPEPNAINAKLIQMNPTVDFPDAFPVICSKISFLQITNAACVQATSPVSKREASLCLQRQPHNSWHAKHTQKGDSLITEMIHQKLSVHFRED